MMRLSRRGLLLVCASAPGALLTSRLAQAAGGSCYSVEDLTTDQLNIRGSVEFVETSSHGEKRCGTCAFFQIDQGDCGSCQLIRSPVTAAGYCDSYAGRT